MRSDGRASTNARTCRIRRHFHNAHLLRATLPRDLLAPIPLFENCKEKHDEFAATLRENWAAKAAKRKAAAADGKKSGARKRARAQADDDEAEEPVAGPSKKRRRTAVPRLPAEPLLEGEGLVAGRAKRTIRRTERARAADDMSEDDGDGRESDADDSDLYGASNDDYSD